MKVALCEHVDGNGDLWSGSLRAGGVIGPSRINLLGRNCVTPESGPQPTTPKPLMAASDHA
jgi:hypothetical protein